jgi:flagellar biogenesis protein FliO
MEMDKMKVIAGILIVIALFGLPCWVCRRKERMVAGRKVAFR